MPEHPAARPAPPLGPHLHDVVDLRAARGEVGATEPGTRAQRLDRLRRLRVPIDPDVLGGLLGTPSHRLTPRAPYQASPEGWLDAFEGTWSGGNDTIWWRVPATFDNYHATCNAVLRGLAAGPHLLTVEVEAWPVTGRTGAIVVFVGDQQASFPVAVAAGRTLDVVFTHDGSDSVTAMVVLRQGVLDLVVHRVTLGAPGIVVTEQPPLA